MRNLLTRVIRLSLFWGSLAGIVYGFYLIHPSLGYIVGGSITFMCAIFVAMQLMAKEEERRRQKRIKTWRTKTLNGLSVLWDK